MYRTYQLTEKEQGKIVRQRWDGDTHYYDVFESQEECNAEQEKLEENEIQYKKDMTLRYAVLRITEMGGNDADIEQISDEIKERGYTTYEEADAHINNYYK